MPVVDASIAVKWFVEESDSPAAHRLLDAHGIGTATLVAPDLLVYEVSNALLHNAAFGTSDVQRSVERLYDLDLELIAPSVEVVTATIALAQTRRLTFYDALYVQLARHLDLSFYTADKRLLLKLSDLRFVRALQE